MTKLPQLIFIFVAMASSIVMASDANQCQLAFDVYNKATGGSIREPRSASFSTVESQELLDLNHNEFVGVFGAQQSKNFRNVVAQATLDESGLQVQRFNHNFMIPKRAIRPDPLNTHRGRRMFFIDFEDGDFSYSGTIREGTLGPWSLDLEIKNITTDITEKISATARVVLADVIQAFAASMQSSIGELLSSKIQEHDPNLQSSSVDSEIKSMRIYPIKRLSNWSSIAGVEFAVGVDVGQPAGYEKVFSFRIKPFDDSAQVQELMDPKMIGLRKLMPSLSKNDVETIRMNQSFNIDFGNSMQVQLK